MKQTYNFIMDALKELASNGLWSLLAVVLIIGLVAYLIKKGTISFNGKGLKVGIQDNERTTLRHQMQYMNTVLDGTIKDIPARLREGLHYYRAKYIIGKVKDVFEEAIIYNHIENDEEYVSMKQEIVYNTILKLTDDDYFKKPEFRKYTDDLTKNLIKRFVSIREKYNGK